MARLVRRNGLVSVTELALVCVILALLCALTTMPWQWQRDRHAADVLTRELALDLQRLREFSIANNMAKESNYSLYFMKGEYILYKGYTVLKRRPYSADAYVTITTVQEFRFNEEGRPTKDMHITVEARSGYERKIVVAAQTGRIRVE